ncbi:DUF2500 domain-containing protein [Streptococcus pneumoniae]
MNPYDDNKMAIFVILSLFLIGLFWTILKSMSEELKNNAAKKEVYQANLIGKRTDLRRGRYASTRYYVTFEWGAGERKEFWVDGELYGLLAEGDKGELSFQGTRFLDFKRQ